ncbi:MAG: DUF1206 domain-containing protein [Verrucomicrobiota bacterium]|nr:DUF1206 domain-containing protein [Verrucomicrobiota bacterium]
MKDSLQDKTADWLKRLTLAGATARGFVYLVVGGMAFRALAYSAWETGGFPGAFQTITEAPLGRLLCAGVGFGLMAFAFARVLEATLVLRSRGSQAWLGESLGLLRVLIDGAIALFAFQVALHPSTDRAGSSAEWAAKVLAHPQGRWVLGLIGAAIVAGGLFQLSKAFRRHQLPLWAFCLALYGRCTYALLLILFGAFSITAGIYRSPGEARGISGALSFLQNRMSGSILLVFLGCGMIAHGVMSSIEAVRKSRETADEET